MNIEYANAIKMFLPLGFFWTFQERTRTMSGAITRRKFLAGSAAIGSAVLGAGEGLGEARRFTRKSPSSEELIKVGVITCGYYSHIEDIWGMLINPPGVEKDGTWWPRQTGMVMTHVWDPRP